MSEEERQAIIHLLDKQARYEYCIKNNISFSDEDYEAYIIRQSMINKDKEIERLNNIINEFNGSYCKIITKCEEMIKNRHYMNDIAIKKYAEEIKDIAKYYIEEPKWKN